MLRVKVYLIFPIVSQWCRVSFVWSLFDKAFSCAFTLPQRLFAGTSPISYHHDRRLRCQVVQKLPFDGDVQITRRCTSTHTHIPLTSVCPVARERASENSFIWVSRAEKRKGGTSLARSLRSPDSCWGKSVSCPRSSPRSFANGSDAPQDD